MYYFTVFGTSLIFYIFIFCLLIAHTIFSTSEFGVTLWKLSNSKWPTEEQLEENRHWLPGKSRSISFRHPSLKEQTTSSNWNGFVHVGMCLQQSQDNEQWTVRQRWFGHGCHTVAQGWHHEAAQAQRSGWLLWPTNWQRIKGEVSKC